MHVKWNIKRKKHGIGEKTLGLPIEKNKKSMFHF